MDLQVRAKAMVLSLGECIADAFWNEERTKPRPAWKRIEPVKPKRSNWTETKPVSGHWRE